MARRGALLVALAFGAMPLLFAAPPAPKNEVFSGKVVPLADLVKQTGSKLDEDAQAHSLVLVTDDGKVYPLIKDAGSRMFFKDKRLLNRPMRLTGRLLSGSNVLLVLDVKSVIKGELHDVYYWCDICSIRRSEKMICECCGAAMDLKEVPPRR